MEPIRVADCGRPQVVRQGLAALLNVVDGLTVVGEAADGSWMPSMRFHKQSTGCDADRPAHAPDGRR